MSSVKSEKYSAVAVEISVSDMLPAVVDDASILNGGPLKSSMNAVLPPPKFMKFASDFGILILIMPYSSKGCESVMKNLRVESLFPLSILLGVIMT